jgi:penicillin-binding protein-related factor A (putative recombinase)
LSTSHALRGRILERAISRAGVQYRKAGRAEIWKQETPTPIHTDRGVITPGTAPIDFLGTLAGSGRAIALEAKQVSKGASFPLVDWSERQRRKLEEKHRFGAWTRLVIAFDEHNETFAIDWPALASFLAAPWRESLSLDWCRAYGELVADGPRLDAQARCVRFLEGVPHADQVGAAARVLAERSAWLLREAKGLGRDSTKAPRTAKGPRTWSASEYRQATPEQRFNHTLELMAYGAKRAGKARRPARGSGG